METSPVAAPAATLKLTVSSSSLNPLQNTQAAGARAQTFFGEPGVRAYFGGRELGGRVGECVRVCTVCGGRRAPHARIGLGGEMVVESREVGAQESCHPSSRAPSLSLARDPDGGRLSESWRVLALSLQVTSGPPQHRSV